MTPDAELQIFAVKRGMIEKRMDVSFFQLMQKDFSIFNMVTLGELCCEEPNYGSSQSAVKKEHYQQPNYIRITDFSDVGIEKNHEFVSVEKYSSKDVLKDKDLLFARTGASVGKSYIHNEKIGFSVFAGYCIRFRLNQEKVLPEYVWAYTKTKRFSSWVQQTQRKSGQPNINKEEYKSILIPLPSIRVQQEMVTKFIIALENRSKKLQQAEELLAGIDEFVLDILGIKISSQTNIFCWAITLGMLKQANTFSPEYFNPERLAVIKTLKQSSIPIFSLEEKVKFQRDLIDTTTSDYKFLGLASIQSNTGERVELEEQVTGNAFKYNIQDVLYCRLRPYLNKVYFAETSGVCSTEFHVMRPKDDSILPEYLAIIMRSKLTLLQTKHMMTGNTHPRISDEDVKALVIPVPRKKVQQKIVDEHKIRTSRARQLRQEAEKEWQDAREQFEKELLGE